MPGHKKENWFLPVIRASKIFGVLMTDKPSVRYVPGGGITGYKLGPASRMSTPTRRGEVIIYLNGMYIFTREERLSVLDLPLSEVESVIYVSGLSASPFQTADTAMDYYPSPVLMVRTKPHVRTDLVPYNVSSAYPIGWQKPVKFYSPKYEATKRKKKDTDNRITVYWNPSLKFDNDGKATVSFYTTDSHSKYRVEVEGRSGARQYHHSELVIERKMESLDN